MIRRDGKERSSSDIGPGMPLSTLLERALALHGEGDLTRAEAAYESILKRDPENFDALHLSGVIAAQRKRLDRARKLITKALTCDPGNGAAFAAHTHLGNVFVELDQPAMALASYDRALALRADHGPAHAGRGTALVSLQQSDAAVEAFERAIRCGGANAKVHHRLGDALARLGRWNEALANYNLALARGVSSAELHSSRAAVLNELRCFAEALASCDRAIALKADYAPAYQNRGKALLELGRREEALASCDRGLGFTRDDARMHANRAVILIDLQRWEEALASCKRAIALDDTYAEAHCNCGVVLHAMRRLDEALASYDRAIELRAKYAEAHSNRGHVFMDLRRLDAAMECYRRAIECRSDYPEAHCGIALVQLLTGEMPAGWEKYEWRWLSRRGPNIREKRDFPVPRWRGVEPLAGKRIFLYCEQGLGDTIQFCRYVPAVAALGAHVVLSVQPPLRGLLSQLTGVAQLITNGEPLPEFDLHCPLLSLPLAFGTHLGSIPGGAGAYLRPDSERVAEWKARLPSSDRPLIGLVWSGSKLHNNDHNRSIPLASLLEKLPSELCYISLQNEVRPSDESALRGSSHAQDYRAELKDFADTAALCECLDLIISVDTSVAHLAGALGRPTWVLLPFLPDWRWLLDRGDSPWYASVSLYRQARIGDWHGVLERAAADLSARVGFKPPLDQSAPNV
jgi:tetratricopeptide (TPR) repeat protein